MWRKGEGKSQFTIQDLLADERFSQAVLDVLSTTDVGRLDPAEGDAGCEVSGWERRGRGEEGRAEAEELGAGGEHHRALLRGIRRRGVGDGLPFLLFFLLRSPWRAFIPSWDRSRRRAGGSCNVPPSRGQRACVG